MAPLSLPFPGHYMWLGRYWSKFQCVAYLTSDKQNIIVLNFLGYCLDSWLLSWSWYFLVSVLVCLGLSWFVLVCLSLGRYCFGLGLKVSQIMKLYIPAPLIHTLITWNVAKVLDKREPPSPPPTSRTPQEDSSLHYLRLPLDLPFVYLGSTPFVYLNTVQPCVSVSVGQLVYPDTPPYMQA